MTEEELCPKHSQACALAIAPCLPDQTAFLNVTFSLDGGHSSLSALLSTWELRKVAPTDLSSSTERRKHLSTLAGLHDFLAGRAVS